MATVTFKGNPVATNGSLPAVGTQAPDFKLVGAGLNEISLADFKGKKVRRALSPLRPRSQRFHRWSPFIIKEKELFCEK